MVFQKIRFISSVAIVNLATLLLVINAFVPVDLFLLTTAAEKKAQPYIADAPKPLVPEKKVISGTPVRIVLPRHGIDVTVEPGAYNPDDGTWVISKENAHYALITPPVNDTQGNTLIYGHNDWPVFYKLKNLEAGDIVEVYTENAQIFTYVYQKSEDVRPDDVAIFDYKGPPKLTLQTCSGAWYEKRQLAEFSLLKVEKS